MFSSSLAYTWRNAFLAGGLLLQAFLTSLQSKDLEAASTEDKLDFNFHIRPILSDRCFKCHGRDENARKAKLRLDLRDTAVQVRDATKGTRAISPGRPEQSELYRRINSSDPDVRMPPPASKLELSDEEKELLRRWILEGAEYKRHWAFIPVQDVPVPAVDTHSKVTNPVDAFILSRLQKQGLVLSTEASRETLIRRLSLDLRGLPPSVQEIDEFLQDTQPQAYDRLVDRLLASPAYGEHQANEWLDLARYADTYGYQADVECDFSPWRDWLIKAFNENLPYDQFVRWQLAGDLLPEPSREQVLATAFNRLHRQTNEGGSIEEEFRTEYVVDRVQTAGTAFLGLTLGCARCHDHKYDPVSQRDFYRLFAFFNNVDESGLYSHFTMATPSPTLLLYPPGEEERHKALKQQIAELERELTRGRKAALTRFEAWASTVPSVDAPSPISAYSFETVSNSTSPDSISTNTTVLLADDPVQIEGRLGRGLRFSGDNSAICKGAGKFIRTSAFSFTLWIRPAEKQDRAVVFHRSRAWTDSGSRGYELLLEEGKPTFSLIHFWPGNAIKVAAFKSLPLGSWSHLAITYDGSSRAAGIRLYLDGEGLDTETIRDNLFKDIIHRKEWGDADVGNVDLTLAGRFRDSGFKNGAIDEFQVFDQCLTAAQISRVAGKATVAPKREALLDHFVTRVDPPCQVLLQQLTKVREEENDLVNNVREIMVMTEMATPRPSYVLRRGAYDAKAEKVEPGTPESILPFPKDAPQNRLGLAEWILRRDNPLTARVAVNRVWRQHFGRGIVATEEDFGIQGKLPTHPELLDWLAARFVAGDWNLKALHKLIVSSATYRQTSEAGPDLLAKDPENLLLARGPKHRLRAEEIRDSALAVSGLINRKIGGPSVRPYQPEGLWEQSGTGKHYVQDQGDALYRRSLYTFWRRTAPPPGMLVFDAPTREVCTARRETTTTPLQALVLLNDPQFVEAARAAAEQLLADQRASLDERIASAYRTIVGRPPREREQRVMQQLFKEQLSLFQTNPVAAEAYLKTGSRPPDPAIDACQLAAMTVLSSTLMNLDEFVMKR